MELEFNIICIGTWAHLKDTWMWSWANVNFTNECRQDAEVLKGLKEKTGFDIFELEGLNCNDKMVYELTAMSVNHLNALDMYRIPGKRSHLFVALMSKN